MKINEKLLLKLEKLARLQLSNDERVRLTNDLEDILQMVDKLSELDTTNVEPLIYINKDYNVLRTDVVSGEISNEAALINAKKNKDGFFTVPKVLKTNKNV